MKVQKDENTPYFLVQIEKFLKDWKIQSLIKNCLYEKKLWEKKNRITESERRERREKREMIRENDFLFFLNTINWDYIHIYSAIA